VIAALYAHTGCRVHPEVCKEVGAYGIDGTMESRDVSQCTLMYLASSNMNHVDLDAALVVEHLQSKSCGKRTRDPKTLWL